MKSEPIFIGGQMKSGTTMLRMLISRHSKIYSGLETHWFKNELLNNFQRKDNKSIEKLKKYYGVADAEMNSIINHATSSKNFIDSFFTYLLKRSSKDIWLEKTPENVNYIDLIEEKWFRYKFIHVIRDFRDVYASWKLSNKYNLEYFVDNIKKTYFNIDDLLGRQTDKYFEIKYENLVLNTKSSMKELFQFLHQDLEEKCTKLDNEVAKSDFEKVKKIAGKESQTLISTQQPINNNKIGQYNKVLNAEEIFFIEKELKDYFILFNYNI
jgi:protein-tyrosine sulfotransferase